MKGRQDWQLHKIDHTSQKISGLSKLFMDDPGKGA